MSDPTKTRSDAIQVVIDGDVDAERQFYMRTSGEGRDLFVRTGRQVIASCQLGIGLDLWLVELHDMLEHVRNWSIERNDFIRACYCFPKGDKILLFFSPMTTSFHFELAEELAKLNVLLLKKFKIGRVEIIQIPWDEADRFFNAEEARLIYGAKLPTPDPVET